MSIELVEASGRSYCRGGDKGCLCRGKIPKGALALRINIYGAGGNATAFYCKNCMIPFLDDMKKVLEEV